MNIWDLAERRMMKPSMCGSPGIEIKYYSVVYFERIAKFDTLSFR